MRRQTQTTFPQAGQPTDNEQTKQRNQDTQGTGNTRAADKKENAEDNATINADRPNGPDKAGMISGSDHHADYTQQQDRLPIAIRQHTHDHRGAEGFKPDAED